jgi:hypothetical protein
MPKNLNIRSICESFGYSPLSGGNQPPAIRNTPGNPLEKFYTVNAENLEGMSKVVTILNNKLVHTIFHTPDYFYLYAAV